MRKVYRKPMRPLWWFLSGVAVGAFLAFVSLCVTVSLQGV